MLLWSPLALISLQTHQNPSYFLPHSLSLSLRLTRACACVCCLSNLNLRLKIQFLLSFPFLCVTIISSSHQPTLVDSADICARCCTVLPSFFVIRGVTQLARRKSCVPCLTHFASLSALPSFDLHSSLSPTCRRMQ